jgi:hypothetical protein
MRTFVVSAVAAVALAGSTAASAGGGPPAFPRLPGNWSHAEINVTIHRQPHTLILDRGRIIQASRTQITVRHPDGTIATIQIVHRTIVTLDGFRAFPAELQRGDGVETMQIDGPPAVRVRATTR